MKIFKVSENAKIPEFATEGSAGFDLRACFEPDTQVTFYNPHHRKLQYPVKTDSQGRLYSQIQPSFRALIPTGLIFDIPKKHVLKLFIRSSMALKNGLFLANSTAIIDSDYVDPTYIMVFNGSDTPITIYHDDRIAQGILEKTFVYTLEETDKKPKQKTDRDGGMGSTGTN